MTLPGDAEPRSFFLVPDFSALDELTAMKRAGRRIVALTAYDAPTAQLADEAGVDVLFVGDSVGTNVLGYRSEQEVTLDDICHHLRAVRRGTQTALILADLPYRTYETADDALANGRRLVANGADIVKLEGGREQIAKVTALVAAGVPVCGHIGLTPQTMLGPGQKARVQGREAGQAEALLADAVALEEAGATALVLELLPEELGQRIAERLVIPCIGIGAGRHCDGQVLIVQDVLGLSARRLKLARAYADGREVARDALRRYAEDVRSGAFPGPENVFATA